MASPIERLRYHVSGAIERGEKQAIAGIPAQEARPDPYGYFARKAAREAAIRAAAPYTIDNGESGAFANFEALESYLKGLGLHVDPAPLSGGRFAILDSFTACHCGFVYGSARHG